MTTRGNITEIARVLSKVCTSIEGKKIRNYEITRVSRVSKVPEGPKNTLPFTYLTLGAFVQLDTA